MNSKFRLEPIGVQVVKVDIHIGGDDAGENHIARVDDKPEQRDRTHGSRW